MRRLGGLIWERHPRNARRIFDDTFIHSLAFAFLSRSFKLYKWPSQFVRNIYPPISFILYYSTSFIQPKIQQKLNKQNFNSNQKKCMNIFFIIFLNEKNSNQKKCLNIFVVIFLNEKNVEDSKRKKKSKIFWCECRLMIWPNRCCYLRVINIIQFFRMASFASCD